MASDSDASRRKHRGSSPDDEVEKPSKRQKHRHHHHRHHRHRSKKHGGDTKQGDAEIAPLTLPPPVAVAHSNRADNDDVEEGEILEEEGFSGVDIKANELREEITDSQNLQGFDTKGNGLVSNQLVVDNFDNEVNFQRDSKAELQDELVSKIDSEDLIKGSLGHKNHKDDKKRHVESRYPSKGSKRKNNPDIDPTEGDDSKLRDCKKSLSSESSEEKHKRARSSSHDKYRDEIHARSRSMSRDIVRERSRSHSVTEDEALLRRKRHHDKIENDSYGERMSRYSRNLRHNIGDSVRNVDREWSVNHNKSFDGEERHYNRDAQDRERSKEREREWERRREKEQERIRDRRREMENERSKESNWRREKEQDRELDGERRREKGQERSRDRVEDIDRKSQKETDMTKDKNMQRASNKDRDKNRERENGRDRYWERNRVRDQYSGKEWERDREKSGVFKSDSENFFNSNSNSLGHGRDNLNRDEDDQDDFEERIALKLAEQEEDDLDRIKEESRKRRDAILEKYRNQQLQQLKESGLEDADKNKEMPIEGSGQPSAAGNFALETHDGRTDDADVYIFSVGKSPLPNGIQATGRISGAAGLGEGSPKSERSDEKLCDDIFGETPVGVCKSVKGDEKYCDDIFGETPVGVRKSGKGEGLPIVRSGLHDNWDDPVGYYNHRFGEVLDGRYEIVAAHGKGVFSTVVRARDLNAGIDEPEEVAIKIIRNNETMRKAGDTEVSILKKLAGQDPENKRHCVRFLSSFKYRNHLCLVFESLHMNLREVLKKFGRDIGLKLTAVRAYAKQLFIALKHLRNCGVLHSDIKPDNMLVNEAKNVLKLCDFGNAMFSGKNEITPYLVSRFYRAPEIILGLSYDHPMDMWSVGCCLYELYSGKVLFPGSTNNDMLRLHMELKGPFPKKMLKKGAFVDQHFDNDLNFHATEEDPVSKKIMKKIIVNIKSKDVGSIISGSPGEDPKMLANFKDLLEKIFVLDPEKRMTVYQALAHPFITVFGMAEVKTGDMWSAVLFTGGSFSGMYWFY
ncbi:hypothetical protein OIU78_006938 [Salix suchowensis]|nr:hypothetical protein OIU78_006938 [Salix suchowensis]